MRSSDYSENSTQGERAVIEMNSMNKWPSSRRNISLNLKKSINLNKIMKRKKIAK
jgi:hypothetical protein